jgi:1,4-dihydroxy-2-naphthoate octaprenyltransferase
MAAVVFLIFAKGHKKKLIVIFINIYLQFILGNFFLSINSNVSFLILGLFTIGLAYIYIKNQYLLLQ